MFLNGSKSLIRTVCCTLLLSFCCYLKSKGKVQNAQKRQFLPLFTLADFARSLIKVEPFHIFKVIFFVSRPEIKKNFTFFCIPVNAFINTVVKVVSVLSEHCGSNDTV